VTVFSVAMRIGHKMGLHRSDVEPNISFFEQEMRRRVWWQMRSLDRCARSPVLRINVPRGDFGNVSIPLNINDADLHPHMAGPPAFKHTGPTEMLYCRMKYEVAHWIRTSSTVADKSYDIISSTTPEGMEYKRKALAELEQIYEGYLRYCDPQIPLHHITATMAHLLIHRARFQGYHPRCQPEGGRHMSQADQDSVFESAVRLLELDHEVRVSGFSTQLLDRILKPRMQIDALVYMLSELRRRVQGDDLVDGAWQHLGRMHEDHPELAQPDGKFYTALADLTLEAWEARWRGLRSRDDADAVVPAFITALQVARRKTDADSVADMLTMAAEGMLVPEGSGQFWLANDEFVDWGSCNELFQF
jgi:hypothetical protein